MAKAAAKKPVAAKSPEKKPAKKPIAKAVAEKPAKVKAVAKPEVEKKPAAKVSKTPVVAKKETPKVVKAEPVAVTPEPVEAAAPAPAKVKVKAKSKKSEEARLKAEKAVSDEEKKWSDLYEKHKSDKPQTYDMKSTFEAAKPLQHKILGWGWIMSNDNDRLEVLFKDGRRLLISNYNR